MSSDFLLELHWIGVPAIVVGLSLVLLWGLQRDRRGIAKAREEIASDDPPRDPPFTLQKDYPAGAVLEDRTFLRGLWGADTPDLVATTWADPRDSEGRHHSFRHVFLPIEEGWGAVLEALEEVIFEAAELQGVPEGSLLEKSRCFLQIPWLGGDVAIQTQFSEGRFHHHHYLIDGDGKLHASHRRDLPLSGAGNQWGTYRALLTSLLKGADPEDLREEFLELASHLELRGNSHGWLAVLDGEGGEGAEAAAMARHLSLAREFAPRDLHPRLVKARMGGLQAVSAEVLRLNRLLNSNTDQRVQTGFLLAQSLEFLHHRGAARRLCELLLAEAPRHPFTMRLLQQIDQQERGAQT